MDRGGTSIVADVERDSEQDWASACRDPLGERVSARGRKAGRNKTAVTNPDENRSMI